MLIDKISKIINCEMCTINKMHKMIIRVFISKIIKSFEILFFDIIINDIEFNKIICIAHLRINLFHITEFIFYQL